MKHGSLKVDFSSSTTTRLVKEVAPMNKQHAEHFQDWWQRRQSNQLRHRQVVKEFWWKTVS